MLVPVAVTPKQFADLAEGWFVPAESLGLRLTLMVDLPATLGWREPGQAAANAGAKLVRLPADTPAVLRRGERVRYTPATAQAFRDDTFEVSLTVGLADVFGGYAPGRYLCTCRACRNQFEADKRALRCFSCALKAAAEHVEAPAAPAAPVHQPGVLVSLTPAAVARLLIHSDQHRHSVARIRDAQAHGNGADALAKLADTFQHACGHALTPVAAGAVLRELVDRG